MGENCPLTMTCRPMLTDRPDGANGFFSISAEPFSLQGV